MTRGARVLLNKTDPFTGMTPLISLAQKQGDKANDMKASSDSDRSWSWDCYTRFDAYKKVSNVHALSKADCVHFIANLMNEEEAVGEVTTVATSRNSLLTTRKRTLKESEKEEGSDDDDRTNDAEDAST
jgi:hypothetical protein